MHCLKHLLGHCLVHWRPIEQAKVVVKLRVDVHRRRLLLLMVRTIMALTVQAIEIVIGIHGLMEEEEIGESR